MNASLSLHLAAIHHYVQWELFQFLGIYSSTPMVQN